MDKINRIVIAKKEAKALKSLSRLFEIMGIDLESLVNKVESQEKEIESLNQQVVALKATLKSSKEENVKLINESMTKIYANMQKVNKEAGGNKSKFSFEGKKIDEDY